MTRESWNCPTGATNLAQNMKFADLIVTLLPHARRFTGSYQSPRDIDPRGYSGKVAFVLVHVSLRFLPLAPADMMRQAISLCACLALCTDVAAAVFKPPLSHWAVPDRGGDSRNRTRPTSADCKELYFDQLVSIHGILEGSFLASLSTPPPYMTEGHLGVSRLQIDHFAFHTEDSTIEG